MPTASVHKDEPAQPDSLPPTTSSVHKDPAYTGDPAWTNLSLPRGWSLEKFAGRWNHSLASWAHHARSTFIKAEIKPSVWVILASFHLEGPAQVWWRTHRRELDDASWDEFIARLKKGFPPPHQQYLVMERLGKMTFNGDWESYNNDFASVAAAVDPDMPFAVLQCCYLRPLPVKDQINIRMYKPKDFDQLYLYGKDTATLGI